MFYKSTILVIIFLSLFCTTQSLAGELNACDLITKETVEKSSGLIITNVTSKDRGVFTSCTYDTDNWKDSIGLIYHPGGKTDKDSAALATELQEEFEHDEAPYKKPEPVTGLGDAAAYYQSADGGFHAIVVLKSGASISGRLVVSAPTRQAALAVAKAVFADK
ncbi:MAG: hypothetical protein JSW20_14590 [Nitrospiraceae bacterium]|nr:MAG: hypothetical protein JSW20_14590 [Nitrospiraceae bacterium]